MSSCKANIIARDYVTQYWPTKKTEGLKIKDMYDRIILQKQEQEQQAAEQASTAINGTVNGAPNGAAGAASAGTPTQNGVKTE